MPTILIKKNDVAGTVPTGSQLTNLAGGAEIAVNTADKRLFTMDSSSAVVEVGINPTSLSVANNASINILTSTTATITTLNSTSATITTLGSTSANITTLTGTTFGTTATTQLRGASADITNLSVSSMTIASLSLTNATFTSATITTLKSTSALITNLSGTSADITTITGTTIGTTGTTQLRGASAQITTLTATSSNITTLSGTTATYTSATVTNLAVTSVTLSNLNIASANITTLTSASGTITNLLATTLSVSDAAVISVNSSTNALRITQTGTGNALLVEDEANPDSTPFVIDQTGVVIVGNTTTVQQGTTKPQIQIQGTNNSTAGFGIFRFSNDTDRTRIVLAKSRGALGAQGIVQSGDVISNINSFGSDGTNWIQATGISSEVDGTPGTNDMPGRIVFSTTADGASSPTERMRIDNAGKVGIGTSPTSTSELIVSRTATGNANQYGILSQLTAASDVTSVLYGFTTSLATAASSFTLGSIRHFSAAFQGIGSGSTVTDQMGFFAGSALTGATNNYGFYGNIASGSGRYNLYMNGTADNYMAGALGIGGTPAAGSTVWNIKNITGATTSIAYDAVGTVQSDVTSSANGYRTNISTAAAAFTVTALRHFYANQSTIGATSAVTNQYGFVAESNLTGATNNYGFYGAIASGSNRYNLYMAGTADNYIAGNLGLGITAPLAKLDVSGDIITASGGNVADAGGSLYFKTGTNSTYSAMSQIKGLLANATPSEQQGGIGFYTRPVGAAGQSLTERMRIDSAGQVGIGSTSVNGVTVSVGRNITGGVNSMGVRSIGVVQSDVTTSARAFDASFSTAAAAFTLPTAIHYYANGMSVGAGSTITNQSGFYVESSLTGATNNYAFYGAVASGSNRWNFYAAGTAANYMAGSLGIGGTAGTAQSLYVGKNLTGATTAYSVISQPQVQSDVTNTASVFYAGTYTAAAAFTLGNAVCYDAVQTSIGSGSAITNQFGFRANSSLTGATNNYGFYSDIGAAANRWNFYANGTARNYFAGGVEVVAGTTGMTAGFVNVPAAAGAPTGVPTNPSGNVPLYYDTTNNKLYVYNGAWKSVALT